MFKNVLSMAAKLKKNIYNILQIIFITLILFSLLISSFNTAQALESQKWRRDLDYLAQELPERHKNLFFKISRDEFRQQIDLIKEDLDQLNDLETVLRLQELFVKIGDPHTYFNYTQYLNYYYPVSFKNFSDEYRVMTTEEGYKNILGARLISINGHPIEEIRKKLSNLIIGENDTALYFKMTGLLNLPEILEYRNIVNKTDSGGNIYLFAKNGKEIKAVFPKRRVSEARAHMDKVLRLSYKPSTAYKNADQLFWHEYFEEEKALYFQYNQCWSRELEKKYRNNDNRNLPSFVKAKNEIFNVINREEVEKLIIDLRFNSGGASSQGTQFAEELSLYKDKFKSFVIIGPRTFSSAIINAVDFKKQLGAYIVGRPTTSRPNHYGEVKSFKLPGSGIQISYSTKHFTLFENEDPDALYPDIHIDTEFKDFVNGEDTILNLIFR